MGNGKPSHPQLGGEIQLYVGGNSSSRRRLPGKDFLWMLYYNKHTAWINSRCHPLLRRVAYLKRNLQLKTRPSRVSPDASFDCPLPVFRETTNLHAYYLVVIGGSLTGRDILHRV